MNKSKNSTESYWDSLLQTLKSKKWDYLLSFFTMIIGIWIGFYLSNLSGQKSKNESTIAKLNYLYDECASNLHSGEKIYEQLNDTTQKRYMFPQIITFASDALELDDNLYNVVNTELYSLLLRYFRQIKELQSGMDTYCDYLNRNNNIFNEELLSMNEYLIRYSAFFIATSFELRNYLRKRNFSSMSYRKIYVEQGDKINDIRQHILDGKFRFVRPESTYNIQKSRLDTLVSKRKIRE